MTILQGAMLGLIQGIGEFLPISSSGHLLLVQMLMKIDADSSAMKMLDILLHVGTLIPVLFVFWKDWADMILHPVRNRTLLLLFIASLPTLVVYFLADKLIHVNGLEGFEIFDSGWFLGVSFLITALFLLICDRIAIRRQRKPSGKVVRFFPAVVMGFFQGIALIPGVSRSGSTILGGVSTGLNKTRAARFSFLMSAPAILGSLLMEGKSVLSNRDYQYIELFPSLVGITVAAVTGFLAIRFMMRMIGRISLSWFSVYLVVLAIVILLLQLAGSSLVPAFELPAASRPVQVQTVQNMDSAPPDEPAAAVPSPDTQAQDDVTQDNPAQEIQPQDSTEQDQDHPDGSFGRLRCLPG